ANRPSRLVPSSFSTDQAGVVGLRLTVTTFVRITPPTSYHHPQRAGPPVRPRRSLVAWPPGPEVYWGYGNLIAGTESACRGEGPRFEGGEDGAVHLSPGRGKLAGLLARRDGLGRRVGTREQLSALPAARGPAPGDGRG